MLTIVLRGLRHRGIRSWLTVVGVVIGTVLLLTLIFLGGGLKQGVAAGLERFGGGLIFVIPGKEENPFAASALGLKMRDSDIDVIRRTDGVRFVMPYDSLAVKVEAHGETKTTLLYGSPWKETSTIFRESRGYDLAEGSWPERDGDRLAVAGANVAEGRFERKLRVGDDIVIRGRRFTIAGIMKKTGDEGADSTFYVSLDQFRRVTGETGVTAALIKAWPDEDVDSVAAGITASLADKAPERDFAVITAEKALDIVGNLLGVVQVVLSGIAAVAILVGGVGIMNSMFTSILERTRQFGILKAVGATTRDILVMTLVEAGIIGAVGGVIGVGISIGIAKAAEFGARLQGFTFLEVVVSPLVVLAALAFTFGLGLLFGAIPAWQASRLRPTEALRYE